MDIIVSAPGKVILHGEHAVVYGKRAIAASLDLRTFVHLKRTNGNTIKVSLPDIDLRKEWTIDDILEKVHIPLCDRLKPVPPTEELLKTLTVFAGVELNNADTKQLATVAFLYLLFSICYNNQNKSLPSLEVLIASNLPTSAGLGSSAAFSACLASAFLLLSGSVKADDNGGIGSWTDADRDLINGWAFQAEKIIHGNPSGIDNSVSTFGGAIRFQGGKIVPLKSVPTLRILLFNTKVPRSTKVLVSAVRERYTKYPNVIGPILNSMEAISEACEAVFENITNQISEEDLRSLQELADMNHSMLAAIGVSHASLEAIRQTVTKHKLKCKLTGAGGGGCAFAILPSDFDQSSVQAIQQDVQALGFDCWETAVGGLGVIQHFKLDSSNYTLPDSFTSLDR